MFIWKQYFLMEYHNLKTFVLLPSWKVALYLPSDISISLLKTLGFPLRVEFLCTTGNRTPTQFLQLPFPCLLPFLFMPSSSRMWNLWGKSSVQFSCSVMSDSLWPHELQHVRPPCPSPTPGVHSNSHPSSRWCHPAISSSVIPFSSCPQSLPASGSFPMSQLFAWGGQSIGISPSKEHPGLISFRMDWLDLLAVQGTLKSLPQHHSSKASVIWCSAFFTVQLLYPYMTTRKTIALTRRTFVSKVMSLLLNRLSRVVNKQCFRQVGS